MYVIGTQALKHMALVKIAATLWSQEIVRTLELVKSLYFKIYQKMEATVIKNVSHLPQPGPLKKEILCFIKPIGSRILKWLTCHSDFLDIVYVKKYLNRLSWTPQGTIDTKKTAGVLIKDENLDITKRYELACIYCLEDDIPKLRNKIPENYRNSFCSEEDPISFERDKLVVLWTCDFKGEIAKMDPIIERSEQYKHCVYQYAFELAVIDGNKAATEYFFKKLTSTGRADSLVGWATNVAYKNHTYWCYRGDYNDILCFLLSQMDKELVTEVFKSSPRDVLECLLDLPWQSFFMETANAMWAFLSVEDYEWLLIRIVDKVMEGYKDYDYQTLFCEFWKQSPNAHKRCVLNECDYGSLLPKLFQMNDEENIKLLLQDASRIEKMNIIFDYGGQNMCEYLVYDAGKWNLLDFLIRECISSKDELIHLKRKFKEHITRWNSEEELSEMKDTWDKCFQLLDDNIFGSDKRKCVEEGNSTSAKRVCSTEFGE